MVYPILCLDTLPSEFSLFKNPNAKFTVKITKTGREVIKVTAPDKKACMVRYPTTDKNMLFISPTRIKK